MKVERRGVKVLAATRHGPGGGLICDSCTRGAAVPYSEQDEEEEVDRMVATMDKDQNGEIDINEFVDAMMMVLKADTGSKNSDDEDSDLDEFQISLVKLQETLLTEVNE